MHIKGTDLQGILKSLFSLNYFTKIEKGRKERREGEREEGRMGKKSAPF